ncbi:autotransporter outer membrane beta-barrel domain-containing protein [Duffyella gerundensis]|uniref:autotransporter outer membrane beta-barrel domain-containing protein n=1 Tax=Duffyella gerundensis TaxID=1619313 RepID=UPI003FD4E2D9
MKLSLLTRSCLLALATGGVVPALQADAWRAEGGESKIVTSGHTTSTPDDYPLYAEGAGSTLISENAYEFNTTGNDLYAAYALDGGTIIANGGNFTTNGTGAHGLLAEDATLVINGGTVATSGSSSHGIMASGGAADISLEDLNITTSSNGSNGINMTSGILEAQRITLTTSGSNADAVSLDNSQADLSDNSSITTRGNDSNGVRVQNNSRLTISDTTIELAGSGNASGLNIGDSTVNATRLTVTAANSSRGIVASSSDGTHRLQLSQTNITTDEGDALVLSGGEAEMTNLVINSNEGYGIRSENTALTLNQGTIETGGRQSDAIWLSGDNSVADIDSVELVASGLGAHAVLQDGGNTTLRNSELRTSGIGGHVIDSSNGVFNGDNLRINSSGAGGHGVLVGADAVVTLINSEINSSGSGSAGMRVNSGGRLIGSGLGIDASGGSAVALQGGDLQLSESKLHATGTTAVLDVQPADDVRGQGRFDNVSFSSEQGALIKATGGNADLIFSGSGELKSNGGGLLLDATTSGTSDLTVQADNYQLAGDMHVGDNHRAAVTLSGESVWQGAASALTALSLNNSRWLMTLSSTLGALNLENGRVNFGADGGNDFQTLTTDSLSGSGEFALRTDIANLLGDRLQVTADGASQGNHTLVVEDSGRAPQNGDDRLMLVDANGGDARFSLAGEHVDAGAFRYYLQEENSDWYLATLTEPVDPVTPVDPVDPVTPVDPADPDPITPVDPVTPVVPIVPEDPQDPVAPARPDTRANNLSKGANAGLGQQTALIALLTAENATLVERMGELRTDSGSGFWVRIISENLQHDLARSRAFEQHLGGLQLGSDKRLHYASGDLLLGGLFSTTVSQQEYGNNSSGQLTAISLGGYATWLDHNGFYADAVVKFHTIENTIDMRNNLFHRVDGDSNSHALTASLEVGKQWKNEAGWFVEPQAQLTSFILAGDTLTLDNELEIKNRHYTSLQSRFGVRAGRDLALDDQQSLGAYAKVSKITEHGNEPEVRVDGVPLYAALPGNRMEYAVGVNWQLNDKHKFYAEAGYGHGKRIEQPMTFSAGYRYSF